MPISSMVPCSGEHSVTSDAVHSSHARHAADPAVVAALAIAVVAAAALAGAGVVGRVLGIRPSPRSREQRYVMPELDQSVAQVRHHPLGAPIEFWRDSFGEWCNLGDVHGRRVVQKAQ